MVPETWIVSTKHIPRSGKNRPFSWGVGVEGLGGQDFLNTFFSQLHELIFICSVSFTEHLGRRHTLKYHLIFLLTM